MTHRAHLRALAGRLAAGLVLTFLAAGGAGAQSLLANRGLGLVVEPRSTRESSLGGVSLGLPGGEISWTNPAGAVGLPAAGLTFAFQYDDVASTFGGEETSSRVARFPLVLAAFPFGSRWAATVGFGSYLDQNWALQRRDSLFVEGDTLLLLDQESSEGGVGRFRVGAAYRPLDRLALGVGVDVYTGGVRRTSGRMFAPQTVPSCCRAQWDYSGVGVVGSIDWNAGEAMSLSVGGSWGGTLDAEPRDTASAAASYKLPLTVDAGASARVAPQLLVVVGADWSGWSTLDGELGDGARARDAWSVQGGVEWDAVRVGTRVLPLRFGARMGALPFRAGAAGDAPWADERAFTGGTGLVLGGGAASMDVGVERGERSGEVGFDESFWRVNLSVSVLGR